MTQQQLQQRANGWAIVQRLQEAGQAKVERMQALIESRRAKAAKAKEAHADE